MLTAIINTEQHVHSKLLFWPFQVIAGAAPHPLSVVCGAALRRAGLVTAADCPESTDGTGRSAWGPLGLPGDGMATDMNHGSNAIIQDIPYLSGFVSFLWAFMGFRRVVKQWPCFCPVHGCQMEVFTWKGAGAGLGWLTHTHPACSLPTTPRTELSCNLCE